MSWHLGCRLLGILLTAATVFLVPDYSYWLTLMIGVGFVHYALSFYYAGTRIRALGGNSEFAIPLTGLAGLCALLYFADFPLELYFGLHHAFNEAYLKRWQREGNTWLREAPLRCLLHIAVYICILRHEPDLLVFPAWLLWLFASGVLVAYLAHLAARVKALGLRRACTDNSVELLSIAAVGASFVVNVSFFQFVLYHFIIWTLLPVPGLRARGEGALLQYAILTGAGLSLYFGALSMAGAGQFAATLSFVLAQFYLWSYIHITASLALSSAHPQWIVRLFASPDDVATSPRTHTRT